MLYDSILGSIAKGISLIENGAKADPTGLMCHHICMYSNSHCHCMCQQKEVFYMINRNSTTVCKNYARELKSMTLYYLSMCNRVGTSYMYTA